MLRLLFTPRFELPQKSKKNLKKIQKSITVTHPCSRPYFGDTIFTLATSKRYEIGM